MTESDPVPAGHEVLPPETGGALSVPPPVPQKRPGLFRRLFTSRKKQQVVAMQNGYLEMVDLIRAIRSHLDRQETVQTRVLSMLEKVPGAMDRQHEVMEMFKQQLENGMENNRRLTDSMGNLNHTLASMDESQKASARTVTDLIHRSRESEQLLREVMRRSERRMTALVIFFFLAIVALGFYFLRGTRPAPAAPGVAAAPAATSRPAGALAEPGPLATSEDQAPPPEFADAPEPPAAAAAPALAEEESPKDTPPPPPAKKAKSRKISKSEPQTDSPVEVPAGPPAATVAEDPPGGRPDLTLDQLKPTVAADVPLVEQPVSLP